jgi:hypothetical protein
VGGLYGGCIGAMERFSSLYGLPPILMRLVQGTYWVRLTALPPAGCSNTPVSSNVVSFTVLPPPGTSLNNPIDLTPRDPSRTDTTFAGNISGYPDNYNGPYDRNTPAVFHRYIIRNCLDSIKVSLCNVSGLADPISDTYLHVLTPAGARGPTQCGISNDDACGSTIDLRL